MDQILFATDGNPLPENFKAGYFEGFDGRKLRYALCRTTGQRAKGTIVLLHGRNECIEKYFETIKAFTDYGFWVATFDWRGQGGSERLLEGQQRGHVARFEHYEEDLKIFLQTIVLPDARIPFFAVGHSTGGLVLLSAAPHLANRLERVVVCAPFLDLTVKGLKKSVTKLFIKSALLFRMGHKIFPRPVQTLEAQLQNLTNDHKRFQRNHEIVTQYPEFAAGPPTFRWIHEATKTMGRISQEAFLERIQIPTLILAGTDDGIVPYHSLETISTRFRAGAILPFFGARHELLHEIDMHREPAIAAIHGFFDRGE